MKSRAVRGSDDQCAQPELQRTLSARLGGAACAQLLGELLQHVVLSYKMRTVVRLTIVLFSERSAREADVVKFCLLFVYASNEILSGEIFVPNYRATTRLGCTD